MIYNRTMLIPKHIVTRMTSLTFVIRQDNQAHIINYYACSKKKCELSTPQGLKENDSRDAIAVKEKLLLSLHPHVYSGVWEMVLLHK